jgi:hypothetical protein
MSLAAALLAFQAEAPTLSKNAAGQVGSRSYKYVDLHSIVEQITPLLAKHGLTWTTRPTGTHDAPTLTYELLWEGPATVGHDPTPEDEMRIVEHRREAISGEMPLYLPESPTSQALGSAITYARRYAITCVLNLDTDEDDDGQAATLAKESSQPYGTGQRRETGEVATEPQKKKVRQMAKAHGLNDWTLWAKFSVATIGQACKINDLTKAQASALIDRMMQGALPTGESDVPSGDAPQHETVQDDTLPFS